MYSMDMDRRPVDIEIESSDAGEISGIKAALSKSVLLGEHGGKKVWMMRYAGRGRGRSRALHYLSKSPKSYQHSIILKCERVIESASNKPGSGIEYLPETFEWKAAVIMPIECIDEERGLEHVRSKRDDAKADLIEFIFFVHLGGASSQVPWPPTGLIRLKLHCHTEHHDHHQAATP